MNFEETYKKYFKRVFAYVCARVGNQTTAEDICLNIWQKVFDKFSSFDESKGSIEQWLFTIARNEVNSFFRLYFIKNFFSLTGNEEMHKQQDPQPLENLAAEEDKKLLSECLQALSKKEQDLISLKFFSSLNNREIAKVSGLSESNVGTILKRSLDKIRLKRADIQRIPTLINLLKQHAMPKAKMPMVIGLISLNLCLYIKMYRNRLKSNI